MNRDLIAITTPVYERVDDRGTFVEALNSGQWGSLAYGSMQSGHVMGQHYHRKTQIFFFLTRGQAEITLEDINTKRQQKVTLHEKEGILLQTNQAHLIEFATASDFLLMKSKPYSDENPDTYTYLINASR